MTLGTHAVVGASVASLMPWHPVLAFVAGFVSHFILDAIPHWDYKLSSLESDPTDRLKTDMKLDRRFVSDLFRIALDIFLGLVISLVIFRDTAAFPYVLLLGMAGAVIPDALQFVYFKWKKEPLSSLQRFHIFIHTNGKIHNPVRGIVLQVILAAVVLVSVNMLQ